MASMTCYECGIQTEHEFDPDFGVYVCQECQSICDEEPETQEDRDRERIAHICAR